MAAIKPTLTNVDRLQHNAVSRLTLHVAAATMERFAKLQTWLLGRVQQSADEEGNVDPAKLSGVTSEFEHKWKAAINDYTALLARARIAAGDIAYTPLRLRHNAYLPEQVTGLNEATTPTEAIAEMWIKRRNMALAAAQRRTYSDGLVLSQRIWRLETDGLSRIRATLAAGMDGRTSAVRLSRQLESLLGANQDMPRWAYSRLNKMTATERMNDLTGLLTDPAQRSQGMAYNALRMARTELQYANHAVTSEIAEHSPWITGRYTRLSPAHPQSDICDTWAAGGPYPKTQQILPLHPNCVTPGQLVITERGSIPIEEVQVGDQVLTHRGRFRPVLAAWGSSCKNRVYRITTEAGTLELTGNHPVLTAGGWINAELVQLGDQILYTSGGVFPDLPVTVAEDTPTLGSKPFIPLDIFGGVSGMPTVAVAFDANHIGDQGEIKEVSPNLVFPIEGDSGSGQGVDHTLFDSGWILNPFCFEIYKHGEQAGIVPLLSIGNLLTNVDSSDGVTMLGNVTLRCFTHAGAGCSAAASVVLSPLDSNGFAIGAQGDVIEAEQVPKPAELDSVTLGNLGRWQLLDSVNVNQEVPSVDPLLGFDTQGGNFGCGNVVLSEVGTRPTFKAHAANGANDHSCNLLSLLPENQRGNGSGSPFVGWVASPSQALLQYSTVTDIMHVDYSGTVYNMTVAEDESYTVGGHVVHNCLCRYEEALMSPDAFAAQVRGWVRGDNDFLDDYSDWLGVRSIMPLPDLGTIAEVMDLWINGSVDAQAEALQL